MSTLVRTPNVSEISRPAEAGKHRPVRRYRFRRQRIVSSVVECRKSTSGLARKYIVHFPETYEIWSYGSGYGGSATVRSSPACIPVLMSRPIARDQLVLVVGPAALQSAEFAKRLLGAPKASSMPSTNC